jgi:hypothetical protein
MYMHTSTCIYTHKSLMPWNEALLDVNAYMHACTYVCFYVCVFVYFALVVLWVQHIVKHMPP